MDFEIVPVDNDLIPSLPDFWRSIPGIGLNPDDDSPAGLRRFLDRNPGLSCAVRVDGRLAGTLLCGWDGRRARLYHVCVHPDYRGAGIGQAMAARALRTLRGMGAVKCDLVCFQDNAVGNNFWRRTGWVRRGDLAYWQIPLDRVPDPEPSGGRVPGNGDAL